MQFDLITVIIKKEYYYTYTYLDLYTDEDIRNSSETINLTDYESVELYLDFKEYLYSQIDESLQIKIKLDKNPQNKDSSDLATILGSTLSTILGLIILAVFIFLFNKAGSKLENCCKKEKITVEIEKTTICIVF